MGQSAAGVYQGRYTLNIPKDAWMANMDDELDNHCILCGENYVSGCFRALANINESDWTDEVHDVVPESIKTRWNEVISFVMNSTDEEFKANLGNYFYVDSLIDYYLFGLASCGLDAMGKNQLYMTYDGQRWIASMYDMDSTWGLYWNGSKFVSATYTREEYEDMISGREGNLLYIRLEQLFYTELQNRWAELKNDALSIENIINRFERFTDIAPAELVKEDYASTTGGGKFTGIPSQSTNNIQQIRAYANARLAWTDEYVAALTGGEVDPDEPDEPVIPDEPTDGLLYSLPEATTFNGTSDYVDTGVKLFDSNKDFTVLLEFQDNYADATGQTYLLSSTHEESPWPGFSLVRRSSKYNITQAGSLGITTPMSEKQRVVIVKDAENGTITAYAANATDTITDSSMATAILPEALLLGAKREVSGAINGGYWSGTIYQCDVHGRMFTSGEITDYLYGVSEHKKTYRVEMNVEGGIATDTTGENVTMSYHHTSNEYLDIEGFDYVTVTNAEQPCGIAFYDSEKTFVLNDANKTYAIGKTVYAIPDGVKYCRVCLNHADGSTAVVKAYKADAFITLPVTSWSAEAKGNISKAGVITETGSDSYVCEITELPDGAFCLIVENTNGASYTWKKVALYNSAGAFISISEDGGVTTPHIVRTIGADAFAIAAFPNNLATNNAPAEQIAVRYLVE